MNDFRKYFKSTDEKELKRYFKRKMSLEKSGLARLFDFIVLLILLFAAIFIIIYLNTYMIVASIILALSADICFFLIYQIRKNIKLEKFTALKTSELTEKCTLEKLILLSGEEFSQFSISYLERKRFEIIEKHSVSIVADKNEKAYYIPLFQNHPDEQICVKDVLNAYRKKVKHDCDNLMFISTSKFNQDAAKFVKKIDNSDTFIVNPKDLLKGSEYNPNYPTKEEIDEFIMCEVIHEKTTFEDIKKEAFKKNKYRSYIGLGLIIMLWSYFAGFKFYYPIISCLCFFLAYLSFKKQKHAKSSFSNLP